MDITPWLALYVLVISYLQSPVNTYGISLTYGSYGVVQVNDGYTWGTVCDDLFDITDANIVCRSLGYPGAISAINHWGAGPGNIHLDNLQCTGHETQIWYCPHAGWGVHNCGHTEDAGVQCDTTHDCSPNPCVYGTCTDHGSYYSCACSPGYTGSNCETNINECASSHCVHGQCVDGVNGYTCTCDAGYDGTLCDNDINECSSSPCVNGQCNDELNQYTCSCTVGYDGTNCETNIDECASSPCNNGVCNDQVNMYTCTCNAGYSGVYCDTDVNECDSSPCNNGVCNDGVDQYTCTCDSGYRGTYCETDINECESSPCVNGVCNDFVNRYRCTCPVWYFRDDCSEEDTSYSHSGCSHVDANAALTGYVYRTITARSKVECLAQCLISSECMSTNYNYNKNMCELNSSSKIEDAAALSTGVFATNYYECPSS